MNERDRCVGAPTASGVLASTLCVFWAACSEPPEVTKEGVLERPVQMQAADAMQGGTALTPSQARRLGAFLISWQGYLQSHSCTAVLLSTSAARRETWLLTAAHCFHVEYYPLHTIQPGTCDEGVDLYRARNDGSGELDLIGEDGTTCTHPNWEIGEEKPHDMALVHFPLAVDVETPYGTAMREYYRPVAGVLSLDYASGADPHTRIAVFGGGRTRSKRCGEPSETDYTFRFAVGDYDFDDIYDELLGDIHVPNLDDGEAALRVGDSGGPWIMGPNYGYATLDTWIDSGAVGGVTRSGSCGGEAWGPATWTDLHRSFLTSIAGDAVRFTTNPWWHRTCWSDWCEYSDALRASLIVAATSVL